MQITPQQRERYAAMWESYMRKVERLRARRENALTIIRQVSGPAVYVACCFPSKGSGCLIALVSLLGSRRPAGLNSLLFRE